MSTTPVEDDEGFSDFLSMLGGDDNTSSPPTTVASSGASQTQYNINNANDKRCNTVVAVEESAPEAEPAPVVPVSTTTTTTTTPQPIDVEKGIVSSPTLPVTPQSSTVPNDDSNQVPTPFWTRNRKFAAAAVGLLAAIIVIVGAAVGVSSSKKGAEPSEVVVTVDAGGDVPEVLEVEEEEDKSEGTTPASVPDDVSLSSS